MLSKYHSDVDIDPKIERRRQLTSTGSSIRVIDELTTLKKALLSSVQLGTKNDLSNMLAIQDEIEPLPKESARKPNNEQENTETFVHARQIFSTGQRSDNERSKITGQQAHSLPYTREELKILSLGPSDGVTDEIRAGILWHAIEREQLSTKKMKCGPPTATSILKLLLSPIVNNSNAAMGANLNFTELVDDDAIIVHAIDVVLSHYAMDVRKINPFESWTGAWNLSIGVGKSPLKSTPQQGSTNVSSWWRSYYRSEVLGSQRNNVKMNKGHKITACLLYWAKHMHLNERNRYCHQNQCQINHGLNDEAPASFGPSNVIHPVEVPSYVEFVSEIMRLLVARWYEASANSGVKKRGTKSRPNDNINASKKSPAKSTPKRQKRNTTKL